MITEKDAEIAIIKLENAKLNEQACEIKQKLVEMDDMINVSELGKISLLTKQIIETKENEIKNYRILKKKT